MTPSRNPRRKGEAIKAMHNTEIETEDEEPQQQPYEFTSFSRLPLELQLIIWEFTLPMTPVVRFKSGLPDIPLLRWPVFEIPQPPRTGRIYNGIPLVKSLPQSDVNMPTALHVCQISRRLALNHFYPFFLGSWDMAYDQYGLISWRQRFDCCGLNDIVDLYAIDVSLLDLVMDEKSRRRIDMLMDLKALGKVPRGVLNHFQIEGTRLLYDMGSGRISVIIDTQILATIGWHGRTGRCKPQNDRIAVRASSIEEWLFGSRITIGHVPDVLRHFCREPPRVFNSYLSMWFRQCPGRPSTLPIYSNPVQLLLTYVWLLHRIALGPRRNDFTWKEWVDNPLLVLEAFVALMDRLPCPLCGIDIIPTIEKRFPKLNVETLDVLLAVPRDQLESANQETYPRHLPPDHLEWITTISELPSIPEDIE
ncbi:hypothetical protein F4804DRAFT_337753 [Jackrogersella minutella]|nr:hypothetical protein F4804DRAFT_337753 [Jackrogersella minutella]